MVGDTYKGCVIYIIILVLVLVSQLSLQQNEKLYYFDKTLHFKKLF